MSTLKLKTGTAAQIDAATVNNGTLYVATDKAEIAYDIDNERKVVTDTNTHYTSKNVVGSSTATSNTITALTNGNVYLNSVENGAVTSTHNIKGSGGTTVISDANGNIVIDSAVATSDLSHEEVAEFVDETNVVNAEAINGLEAFISNVHTNLLTVATTSDNGLMSSADKTKLDNLPSITASATEPTTSDGKDGDIWIVYDNTSYVNYGVKIAISNSDPETACVYTDDAEGMSSGYANWKDKDIFKDIKPCIIADGGTVSCYLNRDNMTQTENGATATLTSLGNDIMVEIPKLGYKITSDDSYYYINVTNEPDLDGYCYAAHSKNTEGDCDYIYVGAYLGYVSSSKLYSCSGQSPTVSTTLTDFRTYATNRGSNYELMSFYPLTLLQCLYLIMYKNRNSQSALGQGYTGGSAKVSTGGTNSQTFCYGSTSSTTQVKFLGIEDFWGNCMCWIDGLYCDSSYNIITGYKNMANVVSGIGQYSISSGISSNISGYITKIQGTNNGGFISKVCSGSSTTYWADGTYLYSGCCVYFGGSWSGGASAGAFRLYVDSSASISNSYVAARLLLKHVAS